YTRSSFCVCPYSATDGKAGLAVCVTDAGTHACDIHLVFIPGQGKRDFGKRLGSEATNKCNVDSR
ncbi:MAG: hypothetical protein OEU97_01485, partial [Dehalococcoidia bacterium]|nr:hypothetical protein [Dehalococcoidia bacterium]